LAAGNLVDYSLRQMLRGVFTQFTFAFSLDDGYDHPAGGEWQAGFELMLQNISAGDKPIQNGLLVLQDQAEAGLSGEVPGVESALVSEAVLVGFTGGTDHLLSVDTSDLAAEALYKSPLPHDVVFDFVEFSVNASHSFSFHGRGVG